MHASTLAFFSLPLLTLAQSSDSHIFSLITTHSGDPNVHLQSVHFNGGYFWAGGAVPPTSTYCPDSVQPNCPPPTNVTYLAQGEGSTTASMYVEVPGGQQVYVDGNTGALQHSIPHGSSPAGAVLQPFTYAPFSDSLASFSIPGGAIACPEAGSYKIYGSDYKKDDKSACIGVGLVGTEAGEPTIAWEYV